MEVIQESSDERKIKGIAYQDTAQGGLVSQKDSSRTSKLSGPHRSHGGWCSAPCSVPDIMQGSSFHRISRRSLTSRLEQTEGVSRTLSARPIPESCRRISRSSMVLPPKARKSGVQLLAVEGTGLGIFVNVSERSQKRTRSRGSARIWRPEHQGPPSLQRFQNSKRTQSRLGSSPWNPGDASWQNSVVGSPSFAWKNPRSRPRIATLAECGVRSGCTLRIGSCQHSGRCISKRRELHGDGRGPGAGSHFDRGVLFEKACPL